MKDFFEFRAKSRHGQDGEYRASVRLSAITQIIGPEKGGSFTTSPYVVVADFGHTMLDIEDLDRLRAALGIIE